MRLHVMRVMRECIVAISVKVRSKARMQHRERFECRAAQMRRQLMSAQRCCITASEGSNVIKKINWHANSQSQTPFT